MGALFTRSQLCCCFASPVDAFKKDDDKEVEMLAENKRLLRKKRDSASFYRNSSGQRIDLHSLSWKSLKDSTGRRYYFSVLTGETVWERPKNYVSLRKIKEETQAVIDIEVQLPDIVNVCNKYSIGVAVVGPQYRLNDPIYKDKIAGVAPKLSHCLFYQPLFVSEMGLYPESFVEASGLKNIVFVGNLTYNMQPRKAIPVVRTGTLYLDPRPEIIYYLQDVFHHEYFHIIDDTMEKRKKRAYAHRSLSSHNNSKKTKRAAAWCDDEWHSMNVKGFQYGRGGALARDSGQFITGENVVQGFLNKYSTSAVEEDKAEVFAGMMRHPDSLMTSADLILRNKGLEMMKRLEDFCNRMDHDFWDVVRDHQPYGGMSCAGLNTWQQLEDQDGNAYWYNPITYQSSWLDPKMFYKTSKDSSKVVTNVECASVSTLESPVASREPARKKKKSVTFRSLLV